MDTEDFEEFLHSRDQLPKPPVLGNTIPLDLTQLACDVPFLMIPQLPAGLGGELLLRTTHYRKNEKRLDV
jgi:hypothetical protein